MSVKNMGVPIKLDIDRNLIFTLNVLEKCIDKFGKMDNILNDSFSNISTTKWLAVQMLNEDAEIWNEEHSDNPKSLMTEERLSRLVFGIHGVNELQNKVQEAMLKGLPEDKVKEVEEMAVEIEKNMIAAQREKIFGRKKTRK